VPIKDTDRDGLDDDWEMKWFGNLAAGPADDPDRDGRSNAVEQALGSNPLVADPAFELELSRWNSRLIRVSWPANPLFNYEVLGRVDAGAAETVITNLPGQSPELEWIGPANSSATELLRVRALEK